MTKPRLLIISDVLPFPAASGQQQRVALKLQALRPHFHISFLTALAPKDFARVEKQLLDYCDAVIFLEATYQGKSFAERLLARLRGLIFSWQTGLKFSNYRISQMDYRAEWLTPIPLSPSEERGVASPLATWRGDLGLRFDLVLFEYFHAYPLTAYCRARGIPTVLDMHDILWKSFTRQVAHLPKFWRERQIALYKEHEESAWNAFDALIAINLGELAYVQTRHPQVFYAPMGLDLTQWPYQWQPSEAPRLAYYGGLGSSHNQADARYCYEQIMPRIWQVYPDAELWLVGSNPPASLRNLGDKRVHVTGFVEDVQTVLKTMALVLCPFTGQYGFRSRLIEVMALGVPVVASPDAVHGMGLEQVFLAESAEAMAEKALTLLADKSLALKSSQAVRHEILTKFSFEATYGRLAQELLAFIKSQNV